MDLMGIRRRLMMAKKRLPNGYQEVDYIESSGTQYIDTSLIMPTKNFKICGRFLQTHSTNAEQAIFSIWKNPPNYWNCFIRGNQQIDVYVTRHHEGGLIEVGSNYDLSLTNIENNWTINLNGIETNFSYTPTAENNTTLKLFTRGDAPSISFSNTHIKMYHCAVYVSGNKVRDFIPCYRKSDGEVGMYDMIYKTFYTNAGTGTFTKGADV